MAANEARRDLAEKLRLERVIIADIRRFNRTLVRETTREYAQTGRAFRADTLEPELAALLSEHYDLVGSAFDGQITDSLPEDIEATNEELAAIAAALGIFFGTRSKEQALIITNSNLKDISSSIDQAVMIGQEEAAAGRPQGRIETAMIAGAVLSRKLNGRVRGISSLETQAPAEAAKATEAQILAGQPPGVTGGSLRKSGVSKEWFTQGDEVVRKNHTLADSQEQDINTPYKVGGELLRFPGDTSLGASAGNVIHCRCSSVVSREDVFAIRRKKGGAPQVERILSEGLTVSIGDLIP